MNTFDDILNTTGFASVQAAAAAPPAESPQPQPSDTQDFNLQAWQEEQRSIKNRLFENLDAVTAALQQREVSMQQYLDLQAGFLDYSAANTLLILAQYPNAQKIGTAHFWKDAGAKLIDKAQSFYILEKGNGYQRADGSIAKSYHPIKVFDISQTNIKPNPNQQVFAQRALLAGVIKNYPGKMVVVDELPQPVVVNEQNDILYLRGMEFEQGFTWTARAVAGVYLQKQSGKNQKNIGCKAWCTAYLLCKKTNVPFTAALDWDKLIPQTDGKKEFREELKDIHCTASYLFDNIRTAEKQLTEEQQ